MVINEFVLEAIVISISSVTTISRLKLGPIGKTGLPVVVVTNQSAIGRGWTTEEIVHDSPAIAEGHELLGGTGSCNQALSPPPRGWLSLPQTGYGNAGRGG